MAASKKALKLVDDKPARPSRHESKRARLEAQVARLEQDFYSPSVPSRDLAALSNQITKLYAKLDELDAVEAEALDGAVSEDADWEAI